MSNHEHFIAKAKDQLDKLGDELFELDQKVKLECRDANAWYGEQMDKLRSEWRDAQSKVERLATEGQNEAKATYENAASEAERHWKALQAAVQTYRQQVEKGFAATDGA